MSTITPTDNSASPSNSKMLRAMVGIGIFCALAIVTTYQLTLPRIESNRAAALQKAIFQVLPGIETTRNFGLDDENKLVPISDKSLNGQFSKNIYAGYDTKGNLQGVAIEASGQGYADIIKILYGYQIQDHRVVGFYVLESKETPGLGDKIEKDDNFKANFSTLALTMSEDGKIINHIIPVKNGEKNKDWEVECITGATISSRAIGNILGKSTAFWAPILSNQQEILLNNRKEG